MSEDEEDGEDKETPAAVCLPTETAAPAEPGAAEPEAAINPSSPEDQGEAATSDGNVNPMPTDDAQAASTMDAEEENQDEVPDN